MMRVWVDWGGYVRMRINAQCVDVVGVCGCVTVGGWVGGWCA
jgi:hypothetical protein